MVSFVVDVGFWFWLPYVLSVCLLVIFTLIGISFCLEWDNECYLVLNGYDALYVPTPSSEWGVDPLVVTFGLIIMDFVVALLFSRFAGKVGFFGGLTISAVVGNVVFPVYIPVWIPLAVGIIDFIVLYGALKGSV